MRNTFFRVVEAVQYLGTYPFQTKPNAEVIQDYDESNADFNRVPPAFNGIRGDVCWVGFRKCSRYHALSYGGVTLWTKK